MKYVAPLGYAGTAYDQSVVFHYKMDIDRDVLNRWFVNIFDQGVLSYTPSATAVAGPTIAAGTSFIIKERTATSPNVKIAKVDQIIDYTLPLYVDGAGYALIAMWENAATETRGVEYYLKTPAEMAIIIGDGENYVQFGTVNIGPAPSTGKVTLNTTTGQTIAAMASGLNGWSGFSGEGSSGFTGYSGYSGAGESGYSGYDASTSGWSGYSGNNPGSSGYSGYSGYSGPLSVTPGISGYSGYSGKSGYSGIGTPECILLTASDEVTPLTTGTKITFRMPYKVTLSKVKASLTVAGSSKTEVDVKEEGGSIFTGTIPIPNPLILTPPSPTITVTTSSGLTDTSLEDDAIITVSIVSAGTGATGLKVYLIGVKG
jgi:hypothetical protein